MSLPEVLLWRRLRGHGFRRQHPLGPYILDFYHARARLCIEIDGQQHDLAHDRRRDAFLEAKGVQTIRISAVDVLRDPEATAEFVLSLHESSSPRGRGPRSGEGGGCGSAV